MKHNHRTWICCLLGFLACQATAHALGHPSPELPELVREADAVCIGRVMHIQELGPTQVDLGYRNSFTNELSPTAATNAVAEVAVQSVLKGKISQKSITVTFYKNVHQGQNPTFFTELAAGETDMIFLTATGDEARFSLAQPNTAGKSKIVLGDAKIGPIPAATPPLRASLLALADALAGGSRPAKMDCLDRIGSIGFTLNLKPGDPNYSYVTDLMKSLNEPGAPELNRFVNSRILPAVLRLTADKDAGLRDAAFLAAGNLQDVDVIPALAKIADKEYQPGMLGMAACTLSHYHNPAATRALVGVLGDSNPNVRSRAADALRNLADPVAVPSLLEHLEDSDPDARYYIEAALLAAIDPPDYSKAVVSHDEEDSRTSFWKKWAADHQDKVAALREQFLAPLPVRATR